MKKIFLLPILCLIFLSCEKIPKDPYKGGEKLVKELNKVISKNPKESLDEILNVYWDSYQGDDKIIFCKSIRAQFFDKDQDDIVNALAEADYKIHPIYKEYLINIHDVGFKEGMKMLNEAVDNPEKVIPDFKNTPSTAAVLLGMLLANCYDSKDYNKADELLQNPIDHFSNASYWERIEFFATLAKFYKESGDMGKKSFECLMGKDTFSSNRKNDFMYMMLESYVDFY